jgi:hypothetical protein
MIKALLTAIAVTALLFPTTSEAGRRGGDGIRPNIVLIMLDDLGRETIPAFNSPYNYQLVLGQSASESVPFPDQPSMPHLNELMRNGINYSGLWTGAACQGTRQALIFGQAIDFGEAIDGNGNRTSVSGNGDTVLLAAGSFDLTISAYMDTHAPEYLRGRLGKKCLFGGGVLTGGATGMDFLVQHPSQSDYPDSLTVGCSGLGTGWKSGPTKSFTATDSGGGTTFTFGGSAYPNPTPRVWYPQESSTAGFINPTEGGIEVLKDVLDTKVFDVNDGINHQPFVIGLNTLPDGHGASAAGYYDSDGFPLPDIIDADTPSARDAITTYISGWDGGSWATEAGCPGYSAALMKLSRDPADANYDFDVVYKTYKHACQNRELELLDRAIGRIVEYLGPKKLLNTYIIITNDNGSDTGRGNVSNQWVPYASPFIYGEQDGTSLTGRGDTIPNGACSWEVPINANNTTGAPVSVSIGCGKAQLTRGQEASFNGGLVIAYGPLPARSRGSTSHARLLVNDLSTTISKMVMPNRAPTYDGYDISETWGDDCLDYDDYADMTKKCHRVRGNTMYLASNWRNPGAENLCLANVVVSDPDGDGNVYRLLRAECRADVLLNLTSATPFFDLRPALDGSGDDPNDAAAYTSLKAIMVNQRHALYGQESEGPCAVSGTC